MKKRVIGLFLVLCVGSSMLTTPVYAESTVEKMATGIENTEFSDGLGGMRLTPLGQLM